MVSANFLVATKLNHSLPCLTYGLRANACIFFGPAYKPQSYFFPLMLQNNLNAIVDDYKQTFYWLLSYYSLASINWHTCLYISLNEMHVYIFVLDHTYVYIFRYYIQNYEIYKVNKICFLCKHILLQDKINEFQITITY